MFRPLNKQFFSPNEREGKGDKGEPLGEANGGVKRGNLQSVPEKPPSANTVRHTSKGQIDESEAL